MVHTKETTKEIKKKRTSSKVLRTFDEDSVEFCLSILLLEKIRENDPGFKPNFSASDKQRWTRDIDLLLRVDKRDSEEVRSVIEWCQQDDFWKTVIFSTSNLREKYPTLRSKKEKANEPRFGISQKPWKILP
jgi:hypothetical protein